jgi:hypothetical protein
MASNLQSSQKDAAVKTSIDMEKSSSANKIDLVLVLDPERPCRIQTLRICCQRTTQKYLDSTKTKVKAG